MKLLKFSASWCQPCKQLTKTIESADLYIPLQSVDIDEDVGLTKQYGVRGVPTLVVLDDAGNELARKTGAMSKEALRDFVADAAVKMNSPSETS